MSKRPYSSRVESAIFTIQSAIGDLQDAERELEREGDDTPNAESDDAAEWLAARFTTEQLQEAIEMREKRPTMSAKTYLEKWYKRGGTIKNIRDYWQGKPKDAQDKGV